MSYHATTVSDEERREFLKVLGLSGAVAAGGVTLDEVRTSVSASEADEIAEIGQAIAADLSGDLDAELIASQQEAMVEAASALPLVVERGFPEEFTGPREEFAGVAEAVRPVYDHYGDVGFFESTTERLPEFTPSRLESAVSTFAGSEALAEPLADVEFAGTAGVDLLAEVVTNAEELSDYHWIATDEIPREQIEIGEFVPPMTMGSMGGALLWLEDLDQHLWQQQVLLTDEILERAVWHGQSMAAGFHLVNEGARAIAADDGVYADDELGALLSTGFAVQAVAQGLLPQDVYWITEEMRAEPRSDITLIR